VNIKEPPVSCHFHNRIDIFGGCGKISREENQIHVLTWIFERKRVIFSRKQAIEEERLEKRKLSWKVKRRDRIRSCQTLTNYGAFIDIGVMDGLLHIRIFLETD